MKKLIGLMVTLVALLFLTTPVLADGAISAREQRVLDELNTGAFIGGKQFYFEASETNAAENHLKRTDLSESQVSEAVKNIQAARNLVEQVSVDATRAATLKDALKLLPSDVIIQLQNYIAAAGNAIGVKITFGAGGNYSIADTAANAITVTDQTGSPVYQTGNAVKNTGVTYLVSGMTFLTLLIAAAGAAFVVRKKTSTQ